MLGSATAHFHLSLALYFRCLGSVSLSFLFSPLREFCFFVLFLLQLFELVF